MLVCCSQRTYTHSCTHARSCSSWLRGDLRRPVDLTSGQSSSRPVVSNAADMTELALLAASAFTPCAHASPNRNDTTAPPAAVSAAVMQSCCLRSPPSPVTTRPRPACSARCSRPPRHRAVSKHRRDASDPVPSRPVPSGNRRRRRRAMPMAVADRQPALSRWLSAPRC